MPRIPKVREFADTRLANNYGGWIYCENCNKTIGYLCYVTYSRFKLEYKCNCGGCGSMYLSFDEEREGKKADANLVTIKNRLCCPKDEAPLFTILSKNLEYYKYDVLCDKCDTRYTQEQDLLAGASCENLT